MEKRNLTPIGSVMVVKSLVFLRINHLSTSSRTSKGEIITTLTKDIFEFVRNAKCDKIKCLVVIQEYQE